MENVISVEHKIAREMLTAAENTEIFLQKINRKLYARLGEKVLDQLQENKKLIIHCPVLTTTQNIEAQLDILNLSCDVEDMQKYLDAVQLVRILVHNAGTENFDIALERAEQFLKNF